MKAVPEEGASAEAGGHMVDGSILSQDGEARRTPHVAPVLSESSDVAMGDEPSVERPVTAVRTLVFKIHQPSQRTAATLRRTLRAYTDAARLVLQGTQRDWDCGVRVAGLYNDRLNQVALATELRRRYGARARKFPLHSSLRDALFADLAMALCAYDAQVAHYHDELARQTAANDQVKPGGGPVESPPEPLRLARAQDQADAGDVHPGMLAREDDAPPDPTGGKIARAPRSPRRVLGRPPSWLRLPRTRSSPAAYHRALAALVELSDPAAPSPESGVRPPRLIDLLRFGSRPLYFPRPDGAAGRRNFALMRSEKDGRYYALLYLLPAHDPRARPLGLPLTRRKARTLDCRPSEADRALPLPQG